MAGHPGPPATVSTVIAQVSDPHLTAPDPHSDGRLGLKRLLSYLAWQRKRRYLHQPEVLAAVMADLQASERDHTIVTGDLTQLGLPGECREVLAWLEAQGNPHDVAVIPGNHDVLVTDDWETTIGLWARYFESDPEIAHPMRERLPSRDSGSDRDWEVAPTSGHRACYPSVRRRGSVALIGLDSAVPTAPFYATGRLGAVQLDRLRSLLEGLGRDGAFRFVYVHHSPLPGGHKWRKRLADADALLAVLESAGAELIVHGHGHHEAFAMLPTAVGPMLVVGAPSGSLVGAAGWNRYSIAPDPQGWSVDIDYRRLGPDGMVSQSGGRHLLARAAAASLTPG
jgi:3',5'-cyclic AMP phosphodiesterase CpdA